MNALQDVLPPVWRKRVYAAGALSLLALTAWKASNGDLLTAAVGFLTSAGFGMATSNTHPDAEVEYWDDAHDVFPEDD